MSLFVISLQLRSLCNKLWGKIRNYPKWTPDVATMAGIIVYSIKLKWELISSFHQSDVIKVKHQNVIKSSRGSWPDNVFPHGIRQWVISSKVSDAVVSMPHSLWWWCHWLLLISSHNKLVGTVSTLIFLFIDSIYPYSRRRRRSRKCPWSPSSQCHQYQF